MTDTRHAPQPAGRPQTIPDERFFSVIQKRLDDNPHETIDDIAYTWLFRECGSTRDRCKKLLAIFKAGYIAKETETQPEVPEEIQGEAHQLVTQLVTRIYAMSHQACTGSLKEKELAHSTDSNRWLAKEKDYEQIISDLEKTVALGAEQMFEKVADLNDLQNTVGALTESNSQLQAELEAANSELHQNRETVSQQQIRLNERDETIRQQQDDIEGLRRKLDTAHKAGTELSQQLQASKADEALAISQKNMIQQQLDKLHPKMDEVTDANNALKDLLHQADLAKIQAEIKAENAGQRVSDAKELYNDQIKTLKGRVADLEKQLKAADKKSR